MLPGGSAGAFGSPMDTIWKNGVRSLLSSRTLANVHHVPGRFPSHLLGAGTVALRGAEAVRSLLRSRTIRRMTRGW